jgi:dihydrodipicolinate synthase/N-acetylneuraminate lyase
MRAGNRAAGRREFLKVIGATAIGAALPRTNVLAAANDAPSKPLRGIFPIAQTPFTSGNKIDFDSLVEEVRFIDRGSVHGFVWPQNASEWDTLTETERLQGAEAIASTGKKLRPAIVIGVQAADVETAIRLAKHAERVGADAIISLPPRGATDTATLSEYYKQIGRATGLPLFLQAVGDLSVDSIIDLYRAVPTLRYVKDEAGHPLMRFSELREKSNNELKVFSGAHGRTLIDEMIRGFSGSMPAASFADIYASAWDLWHAGKRREAVEAFGNAAVLIEEISAYPEGMKYILCLRGVFKTYQMRRRATPASGTTTVEKAEMGAQLDDASKQVLRQILDLVKPYLRAYSEQYCALTSNV